MLEEIVVFGLHYHLFVVQIDLNILHGCAWKFDFVGDLLAAIRGRVASVEAQVHVFGSHVLTVQRLEFWLLSEVVQKHWDISYLLLTPYFVFWIYLLFRWFSLSLFLRFGLELVAYFCLYFGIGFCNFFFVFVLGDGGGIEYAAFVCIFDDIRVFLSGDEFLEGHHGAVVEHDNNQQSVLCALILLGIKMKGRHANSRISKREASPQLVHIRTASIKSTRLSAPNKQLFSSKVYEKMLTQTTSSKHRPAVSQSKSLSKSRKEGKTGEKGGKSVAKGRREKMFMAQSLNIPQLDSFSHDEYLRNNSQQLSSNNGMEQSVWAVNPVNPLGEILGRTQKTLQLYEKTCSGLKRQNREMEKELVHAKQHIAELSRQLLNRRSREL